MDPVKLQEWAKANEPSKEMVYESGYWNQIILVRDMIARLLVPSFEEYEKLEVSVISTHTSKSILLPVYYIHLDNGIAITMRYNFHNWKVSINSPKKVYIDFMKLFDPEEERDISGVYCEGFPAENVFGCYAKNKSQFTVELQSSYILYTFFWIFGHSLGLRKQ